MKKIFRLLSVCYGLFAIISCSNLTESNSASLSFTIDRKMAQKINATAELGNVSNYSARSLSAQEMEGLYFEISLKSIYQETKVMPVIENATVNFENIPVGIELYAEASAYRLERIDETIEKFVLYEGKSESIQIKAGENKISIQLKRVEPTEQFSSINLSISLSGTPTTEIEAYEIRVRNSQNEMILTKDVESIEDQILIEELAPDLYTVSVLGYYSVSNDSIVSYYGQTKISLSSNESKTETIELGEFENSGTYICVYINPINAALSEWATLGSNNQYSCTITGNGVNFTTTGYETVGNGNDYGYMTPNEWNSLKGKFLEPGFAYTFDVTVTKEGWVDDTWVDEIRKYHGSTTQIVEESNYSNQNSHAVTVEVE